MDNETWLIEEGDRVIHKESRHGTDHLSTWERLVYALWVADYGMRNAGDLETARDVDADFQSVALSAAEELSLPISGGVFRLSVEALEERYFEMFDAVCDEIRRADPGDPADLADK